jgi:Domain of unknown function (DUF4389)
MTDVPVPPPPAQPPAPGGPGVSPSYPVVVELERSYDVKNWRPLVNWILVIPHLFIIWALLVVTRVLQLISFFTILFTKKNPFVGVQTMILRYWWRVTTFQTFMRNEYPPFDFGTTPGAAMPDDAVLTIDEPGEMNRWLVLVKWLLVIPHLIVLVFLFIGAAVVVLIAFFAVLFTGRWPEGMRNYVVGVNRWGLRVFAYFIFLTDAYPPFSLQ